MDKQIIITLGMLIFAMIMFFTEKIPVWVTSMIVLVIFIVTGILEPRAAFSGFTDSSVLLFMALFIIGDAIFLTGLAQKIGDKVTHLAKTENQTIILIMLVSGILSSFLSNTGTAAIFIPIIVGIAKSSGYSRARLLMPLVASVAMGGSLTLLGSPPNIIASSALDHAGFQPFGVFEFVPVAFPIFFVGTLFYAFIGYRLLPGEDRESIISSSVYDNEFDFTDVPSWKMYLSVIVLIFTVIAMAFEKKIGIPFYVSAWIGALFLVVSKTISSKDAINSIDMSTILLFVGTLSIGDALHITGAGSVLARFVLSIAGSNPLFLLATILIICIILTNFMSNTACAALMSNIGIAIAAEIGADPRAILMAIVIGCSCSYATPIGSPPNTMVYTVGGYKFTDYAKVGIPLIIINFIVSMILLPVVFPFFP
ncbi:MAG: SLC13 family permease [Erysipelotrichaceae bacterium]|jgi:anion transporter|nr:SLC13 family permease [Bacillota bacterium]